MKLLEFTYTKADGSKSNRALVELSQPNSFIEGIDITSMDEAEFAEFSLEMSDLMKSKQEAMQALLAKFDLKHNYRRFIPAQMSEITTNYI